MLVGPATPAAKESESVGQTASRVAVHKSQGPRFTKSRSGHRDQTAKGNPSQARDRFVQNGTSLESSDTGSPQYKEPALAATGRASQKTEAPNRWSKALGGISQPVPATAAPIPQPRSPSMAPGAPASSRQALKATQPQQQPPLRSTQQEQPMRTSGKPVGSASQEKQPAGPAAGSNAAVRIVPRNSNSPATRPRRTSSGGGSSSLGSSSTGNPPPAGDLAAAAARQQQQARNWAGIVSQRPQSQAPSRQQHQSRPGPPPPQPAAPREPFPPLPGDGTRKEPPASPARAWPAPAADKQTASKAAEDQTAVSAPAAPPAPEAPAAPVSVPEVAKPAATSNGTAAHKQDSAASAQSLPSKEGRTKEQDGKAPSQWVAKQQQLQHTQHAVLGSPSASRDSLPFKDGRAGGVAAPAAAGGAVQAHKPQENSLSTSTYAAQALPGQAQVLPVSVSTAPAGLPPNPSNALTSKAASAAAAAATAAVAGVAAATAATQQAQHKAVNLPSSQEVNTAAMSDYASNRTAIGSNMLGYHMQGVAAAPAPSARGPGFEAFGAGFGPNSYEDGFGALPPFGSTHGSHVPPPPAASPAPSAPPAPQAAQTAVAPTSAAHVGPAATAAELTGSSRGGESGASTAAGSYRPPVLTDQDQGKPQDFGRSSSSGMPRRTSSTSSTGAGATRLSAAAPAFIHKSLVPSQVATSSSKSDGSERSTGSILSSQLEQQLFATAQGADATSIPGKAAVSGKVSSGPSSVGAATAAASPGSVAAQLRELADFVERDSSARDKSAAESAEKLRQLQQQVDAAKAAQAAAEVKLSGLNKDLETERRKVKDLESQLAAQSSQAASQAERADALAAELTAASQIRDAAAMEAAQRIQMLQQQNHDQQVALVDLENRLRQWQDKYNSTEADNRGLRDMLGPRAPAPGTLVSTTPTAAAAAAAASGPFETPAAPAPPAAAPQPRPAGKAPPPGFGPAPAAAAAPQAAPAAPAGTTSAAEARHMKNEHELVSTLLSMLSPYPHLAILWGEDETAGLNVQLLPLNWDTHYRHQYGSITGFMQQRPAVFAQNPDGSFYKVPGAEEMVKKAMADEQEAARAEQAAAEHVAAEAAAEARAVAAAAAAPWRVPQFGADLGSSGAAGGTSSFEGWSNQQPQQHIGMTNSTPFPPSGLGMGMSVPYMPPPQFMMGPAAAGMPGPASMPMAPPSVPMGHAMHHHSQGHVARW